MKPFCSELLSMNEVGERRWLSAYCIQQSWIRSVLGQPLPVDEVMLCKVLHAAGHLDGHVGHVPKVQDPLGLPGAGDGHGQVRLGAVGEQVLVQVTLGRALKDQAPAMCMLLVKIPGGQAGCPDFDVRGGNIDVTHLLANFPV